MEQIRNGIFTTSVKDALQWAMNRARVDKSNLDSGRVLLGMLQQDCSERDQLVWHLQRPVNELITAVEENIVSFPTDSAPRPTPEAKQAFQAAKREWYKSNARYFGIWFFLSGFAQTTSSSIASGILQKLGVDLKNLIGGLGSLPNADYDYLTHQLYNAVWENDISKVKRILSLNIAPDDCEIPGEWTALMLAANQKYMDIYELLIEHGADPNLKDEDGRTALDLLENPIRN